MNKIAQKMLHHKKGIVALFAVLAVLCALLSRRVKVDYNMMHYLPKDAPSTIALDVMEEEYSAKTANCRIMIEDAAIPEALALKKQLQQVPGVSEVMWLDDYANVYAPLETLDGDTVESWYKEGNVLFPVLILFILLAVPSFVAKDRIDFAYGSSEIYGDASTQIGADAIRINEEFGRSNQIVCMVPRGDTAREKALSDAFKIIPEVTEVLSYTDTVGSSIPEEYVPKAQRELLISEHYTRMVISTSVGVDGEIPFAVATQLRETAQEYYPDAYLIAGEAVNTLDMRDTVTEDDIVVNGIAVGAIFLILLITFKSLSLPAILVFVIESAIWMNLAVPYLTGERLNYIAYLIINTVQLGATVDYAILFTNKYLENRRENSRWHAARITVRETVVSIVTSGSILCIAGSMLGALSTNGVISQLGYLVGRGAVLSCCMVLFVLPTCLCLFDGLVQKTSLGLRFEKNY